MLNIDNGIDEIIGELDCYENDFAKVNFIITLDKWDDREIIYVVMHVDDEVLEMGNGEIIMTGDDMFEIQNELAKYGRAIKKEFSIKSDYEVLLSGGLVEWYKDEEE